MAVGLGDSSDHPDAGTDCEAEREQIRPLIYDYLGYEYEIYLCFISHGLVVMVVVILSNVESTPTRPNAGLQGTLVAPFHEVAGVLLSPHER